MIVKENTIVKKDKGCGQYSNRRFDCFWNGTIFVAGSQNGKESVAEFCTLLETLPIEKAISVLRGNFFVAVFDKHEGKYFAFVDNSGLFSCFYSKQSISTSLLHLAEFENLGTGDLDPQAIVEFLHFGRNFFHNTLFKDIRKLGANNIVSFSDIGETILITKSIPPLTVQPEIDFVDFFKNFPHSFKDEKISCDLTGGNDTRLIACLLDNAGIDFELAISGMPGNPDIEIAEEVAYQLGRDLQITYHEPDTGQSYLWNIMQIVDGCTDILDFHRLSQLHSDRCKRGITLAFGGDGGALYKDNNWYTDFPLFTKRASNIPKYYSWKIQPKSNPEHLLTEPYREISRRQNDVIIKKLDNFVMDINTQTYDNIYYRFKMPATAGNHITAESRYFKCYHPLLEYDLVRFGFNLPRHSRFLNGFHRKIISEINPAVAGTRTNHTTSMSSKRSKIAMDIFRATAENIKKFTAHRFNRPSLNNQTPDNPDNPELLINLYKSEFLNEIISLLKKENIVKNNVGQHDIDETQIGKFITLGMIIMQSANGMKNPAAKY